VAPPQGAARFLLYADLIGESEGTAHCQPKSGFCRWRNGVLRPVRKMVTTVTLLTQNC